MPKILSSSQLAEKIAAAIDLDELEVDVEGAKAEKKVEKKEPSSEPSIDTKRLEAEAALAKRETERMTELLRASLSRDNDRRGEKPVVDDEEDELSSLFASEDSDDESSSRKKSPKRLRSAIDKIVAQRVNAAREEFSQGYARDQQQVLSIIAEGKKRDFIRELSQQGLGDIAEDIESYIKDNNLTPAQIAMPGVLDVIAQTVVGGRAIEEKRKQAKLLSSSGGRSSTILGDDTEMVDEDSLKVLRSEGVNISAARATVLAGKEADINSWRRVREAEERRAAKRGA